MPEAREARRDAERILARTWGSGPDIPLPVDPVQIAKTLGIDVYDAQLEETVLAALVKEPGQDPTILLNSIDSENRKRFSCAHEIGHFLRHTDDEYQFVDLRGPLSSEGTDPEEIYANNFAAALLMPEEAVRRYNRQGAADFEMALIFDVSREAMRYRLQSLNLLQHA